MRRVVLVAWVVVLVFCGVAHADGPGEGTPAIVAVGDSAISGEAGRWAGNTNNSSSRVDALGSSAYHDVAGREAIAGCHRSTSAEVHIGGGVLSANLACSGARTYTRVGDTFKPGIDFYSDSSGRKGQALALQEYAATHNVKAVVVLIGANNYGFADIVQACVANWLTSPSWWKNYCYDDSGHQLALQRLADRHRDHQRARCAGQRRDGDDRAGYANVPYTILAQTYTSPIPRAGGFRYPETGWTRQSIGGCGVWNRDADWAQDTVVSTFNRTIREAAATSGLPNVRVFDAETAFNGRRLCESTVGLLEERGVANWTTPGAVDATEWVSQIRTVTTIVGPYQLQEGGHPSYWGQLALRNCLRQALQRRRRARRPLHARR